MSKFSRHIKQDSIRNIILKDGPCENKLSELRVMVGLPPAAVEPSSTEGVAEPLVPSGVEENVGDSLRQDSINRILEGLSGRELTMGKNLLNEIEKIPGISWDQNSLELILNGKTVKFSNLNLLVMKVIQSSSNTIPLGLVNFLNALVINKIPMSYVRDGDSKNIRQALIEIQGKQSVVAEQTNTTETLSQEEVNDIPEVDDIPQISEETINETGSLKRKRNDDDDGGEVENSKEISEKQLTKKQKTNDVDEIAFDDSSSKRGRKRKAVVDESELRRSSRVRLKRDLQDSWRGLGN